MNIIETARLTIRPFLTEDTDALCGLLVNDQIRQTYMLPDFPDQDALLKLARRLMDLSDADDHFVRGIYLENKLIGFVNDAAIDGNDMEVGYVIHPDCWGRGYATEMLRAVLGDLLGKRFSCIRAGAFVENPASFRVMEKCGMRRLPGSERIAYRGMEHECVYYVMEAAKKEKRCAQ